MGVLPLNHEKWVFMFFQSQFSWQLEVTRQDQATHSLYLNWWGYYDTNVGLKEAVSLKVHMKGIQFQ